MENRLKLRISRMFHSSFSSLQAPARRRLRRILRRRRELPLRFFHGAALAPQASPSSLCGPQENRPAASAVVDDACIVPAKAARDRPRQKLSGRDVRNGRFCPPTSPVSSLSRMFTGGFRDEYYHWQPHLHRHGRGGFEECRKKNVAKKSKSKSKKSSGNATRPLSFSSSSQSTYYDGDLFSSDDEREDDETETLFSSRSLSSDSSESQSFAVVKRSSDPYGDFRTSMVEMIVERQMFSAKDLERLLNCFLSLNSHHHHKTIVQVFTEIYEALFSNWC
ncbi:LOW QUALITY PROTEIN: transcription repressor OFP8 [Eucalyptus grandis]|uniref:LOW QUALITY PROTEIN: transcription repressor OFP8 n=1 Tax=Eucalyptus grandis TaxID=71139 RepID=UPI00192E9DF5|nr:LOW QUALITY PROTEIN: transcription repressor OFP8 [Eucalyptus grandis]